MLSRTVAVLLILFFSPLFLGLSLLLVVVDGWPLIFTQKRIGKFGAPFFMFKFRTMTPDAEAKQQSLRPQNESDGPVFKIHHDPRFTRLGKLLSHTGLDELPQLFNVLKGDMAFIGPRPLPTAEAKNLKSWMRAREMVLPGIISPAIVAGTYHKDFEGWMRSDVVYARTKSLKQDVILLIKFVPFVARLVTTAV